MDTPSTLYGNNSQTWAVRPTSRPLTSPPPLPTNLLPRGGSTVAQKASSSTSSVDRGSDLSTADSEEETYRPPPRQLRNRGTQLDYKPSFSKPTFQWIRGEILGKGSYGRVYLALNATTGEVMAVKQVELPKSASDKLNPQQQDVMKALKFESDTLRDLDHPNVVQYLGFEESQDFLSIFLEYVPGGTISNLLRENGRLREEVTKSFLSQILCGLEYLHSRGILHRDLKSENILVDHSGVCKISDFGISKKAGEINRGRAFTSMKGTVYWMAPEVLSNEGQGYDMKVDIWSVGCVALEMWSGKRPWSEQEMAPVMMKLFKDKLPPPVPPDVQLTELAENFRLQCFHADPQQRPTAKVLKKHPYLALPSNWLFDNTALADNSRRPRRNDVAQLSTRPPVGKDGAKRGIRGDNHYSTLKSPTLEPPKGSKPQLPVLVIPDWKAPHLPPKPPLQADPIRDPVGPPIVYITPPGSPRRMNHIPEEIGASAGTSDVSEPRKTSKRRLIICNPDDSDPGELQSTRELDSRKPTFVYTPPPLPNPIAKFSTASSNRTAVHKVASTHLKGSPSSASISPSPSLAPSQISSSLPSSTPLKSPRPLPQSPPASAPHRPAKGPDRSQTVISGQPSTHRPEENRPDRTWSAHPVQGSPKPTRTIRRLPISPPLKTASSISHLPSASSRMLMKQKSVPDVSIFSFSQPRRGTVSGRKASIDSESEDQDSLQSDGSTSTPTRSQATHKRRDSLWAVRPRTEDVYEHLESWFPHHDLDQPVDSSNTPDGRAESTEHLSKQRKPDSRKSIRTIAREQNRRSHVDPSHSRRRTRLWNSCLEELKDNH